LYTTLQGWLFLSCPGSKEGAPKVSRQPAAPATKHTPSGLITPPVTLRTHSPLTSTTSTQGSNAEATFNACAKSFILLNIFSQYFLKNRAKWLISLKKAARFLCAA
jgi:hypothetical protein